MAVPFKYAKFENRKRVAVFCTFKMGGRGVAEVTLK